MYEHEIFDSLWWIFPLAMMAICFLLMGRRKGSMMCGFGSAGTDNHHTDPSDSPIDILNKRYARGEIDKDEYDERKHHLIRPDATSQ